MARYKVSLGGTVRAKWITDNILELRFDDPFSLCDTTYRFSHYYEVRDWMGKVATRQELDSYYLDLYGDKDYWKKKWGGANIPDYVFIPFLDGTVPGNTIPIIERMVLKHVKGRSTPFYVIMTAEGYLGARRHEIAHALYYLDLGYKHNVEQLINQYIYEIPEARKFLESLGYSGKLLIDELHAYCGVYYEHYFLSENIKVPRELTDKLIVLFGQHYKGV